MAVIYKMINAIKMGAVFQKINLKWVLSVYLVLLLIAVVLFYFLPGVSSSNNIVDDQEELAKAKKASELLTMAASEGKQIANENISGVEIKNQWDFTFEGKQLEIIGLGEQYYSGFTLVERKDENDRKIEATHFYTRTIIENIDLTKEVGPYTLELEEDELTIQDTNKVDIRIGRFAKEFTISQFTKDKGIDDLFSDVDHIWGENVLYIRVPKDVKIEGDVQFVKE